jgi:hypothetical protein
MHATITTRSNAILVVSTQLANNIGCREKNLLKIGNSTSHVPIDYGEKEMQSLKN